MWQEVRWLKLSNTSNHCHLPKTGGGKDLHVKTVLVTKQSTSSYKAQFLIGDAS